MALDDGMLPAADAARDRVLAAEHALERARADFHHEIRRLHAAGGSMREIGERFGMSHQRVHQIVDMAGDAGRKGRGTMLLDRIKGRVRDWGGFTRFTRTAREVVTRAEEEAAHLGHSWVGTEHLLLGILRAPKDDPAARALSGLGVELEAAREEVLRHVGTGDREQERRTLRFTPRTKRALEIALREADERRHDRIGTEHVLLGLTREPSGLATRILRDLGAAPGHVRAEVERILAAD